MNVILCTTADIESRSNSNRVSNPPDAVSKFGKFISLNFFSDGTQLTDPFYLIYIYIYIYIYMPGEVN